MNINIRAIYQYVLRHKIKCDELTIATIKDYKKGALPRVGYWKPQPKDKDTIQTWLDKHLSLNG